MSTSWEPWAIVGHNNTYVVTLFYHLKCKETLRGVKTKVRTLSEKQTLPKKSYKTNPAVETTIKRASESCLLTKEVQNSFRISLRFFL